jgi:hypothetical protein
MLGKLSIKADQRRELKVLCSIGPAILKEAAVGLRAAQRPLLRTKQLRQLIATVLPGRESDCTTLVRQLLSLHQLQRQNDLQPVDVVELLNEGIQDASERKEWTDDEFAAWSSICEPLSELLSLENVALVAKAIDLAYEYTNIYLRSKIIADLRPVFDTEGTKVCGMITCFTLQFVFDSRDGEHSLGIALDEADVKQLKAECDRAIKKSSALRTAVINPAIPITVFGAADDNGD